MWRRLFSRDRIVANLELVQDFIVVSLCVGLFSVMLIRLGMLFLALLEPRNFREITSDILFVLILVELFRLLIIYLKEQRISVGAAVEVSLVSVLREVILQGALEVPLQQLLGVCAFLGVLGGLLFLRVWMYQQFTDIKDAENAALAERQSEQSHLEDPIANQQYSYWMYIYGSFQGWQHWCNDQMGHSAGDYLLQKVAQTLQQTMRSHDLVARLGGDVFAILLPQTDLHQAHLALTRTHRQLQLLSQSHTWLIGFSIGAITFSTMPDSIDVLINQADQLMYTVKSSGKNRLACRQYVN